MKKVTAIYNIIFNIILLVLAVLLLVYAKVIFVNAGESLELEDSNGAGMLILILVGSLIIATMYLVGLIVGGVSFFSLISMLVKYLMDKEFSKGTYLHHLVIYCIYLLNLLSVFYGALFQVENFFIALFVIFLICLPLALGIVLNAFCVFKFKNVKEI